jgi:uncharacterized alkaline shock family protein YloU
MPLIKMYSNISFRWSVPSIRQSIEERIIEKTKKHTGKNITPIDITEQRILQEYRKLWMETVKKKDKVNMLYNHPSLLLKDYQYID